MKRLASLVAAGCAGHPHAAFDPIRGTMAPDVAAVDLAAHPVRLGALRGKRVLLDFWESTCAPCARALPELAALAEHHERLAIVSITPEAASVELRAFVTDHRMTWIVATDETDAVGAAFRVASYPTYFLLDEAGTITCARCSLEQVEGELAGTR